VNLQKLRAGVGQRVQIVPPALSIYPGATKSSVADDDWAISDVRGDQVILQNSRTGQSLVLGQDHVHHYTSNPARSTDTVSYGFLTLNVQVFVRGHHIDVRPTQPGVPLTIVPPGPPSSGLQRAMALAAEQQFEADTKELLRRDTSAFLTAGHELFQHIMNGAHLLGEGVAAETVIGAREHTELVVFVGSVTLQLLVRRLSINSAIDAHYLVRFFNGRLLTPEEQSKGMIVFDTPIETSRQEVSPTRVPSGKWAWKCGGEVLSAEEVAGRLLEQLVAAR
jgi:hypothetical protein